MPRKIRITLLLAVVFAAFAFSAAIAGAETEGTVIVVDNSCPGVLPAGLDNFDAFVTDPNYFNTDEFGEYCEELGPGFEFGFKSRWYVTAIARESGNQNQVQKNGTVIFDTDDCTTWGLYSMVNFDTDNLFFVDRTVPNAENPLNPYAQGGRFKLCQLTADSKSLSYLANTTQLLKGDFVIGFNDTGGDSDFDDMIVALRARKTCQNPRYDIQIVSSGDQFDGEDFCFEWTDLVNCEALVYACDPGQPCDPDAANTCRTAENLIDPTPLSDIVEDDSGENAFFFGGSGGGCRVVWIKFGENSTRCAVIGGKKYCR